MMASRIPDLVRDSELPAVFRAGYTEHVQFVSARGARRRETRERWTKIKLLGQGASGKVWLEECSGDIKKLRAVKEIQKLLPSSKQIDYNRELEAIAKFSQQKYNGCFVQSFGWYESTEAVFVSMEYFPLGDLETHIGTSFPEREAYQITYQLLEGLQFMHEDGFAHRDLKPANILVYRKAPDWWVKIGDFGISKRAEGDVTHLRTVHGTRGFLAPELQGFIDRGEESDFRYTAAVDIWALGETIFRMLSGGASPFIHLQTLRKYVEGNTGFPTERLSTLGVSHEGCLFVENLMAARPEHRPNAAGALELAWLRTERVPVELPRGLAEQPISSQGTSHKSINQTNIHHLTPSNIQAPPNITEASARWSDLDKATLLPTAGQTLRPVVERPVPSLGIPPSRLRLTLRGHKDWVNYVAFSPNGQLIASASSDRTIKIWDVASGEIHSEIATTRNMPHVVFSPNGKLLAFPGDNSSVMLWSVAEKKPYTVYHGHLARVNQVTFSPKGDLLASASDDCTIRVWAVAPKTLSSPIVLKGHEKSVRCVAFAPNGHSLASGSNDSKVRLWYSLTGPVHDFVLEGYSDWINQVAFSPDGSLIVAASDNHAVRVWNVMTRTAAAKFEGHKGGVSKVAYSPDGKLVASSSDDGSVRLWDMVAREEHVTIQGHNEWVNHVAFSPDGELVITASGDHTAKIWEAAHGRAYATLQGHSGYVRHAIFSPGGHLVASASSDHTVKLWEINRRPKDQPEPQLRTSWFSASPRFMRTRR